MTPRRRPGGLDTLGLNSPFSGVGSIYGGTGTLIDSTHVLTAAHLFGSNFSNTANVTFNLDTGSGIVSLQASQVTVDPLFPGSIGQDDLYDIAVVTLSSPAPSVFRTYGLSTAPLNLETTLTLVGYGQTGDGVHGYGTADSDGNVYLGGRRVGQNTVGGYILTGGTESTAPYQSGNPTYLFDFDSPAGSPNPAPDYLVGPSLGNGVETTLGVGDSGGPAFVFVNGQYQIAAINNFVDQFGTQQSPGPAYGFFGSGGGGAIVSAYSDFISGAIAPTPEPGPLWVFGVGTAFVLTAAARRARKR